MTRWSSSIRMVTLPCPSTRVSGSMTSLRDMAAAPQSNLKYSYGIGPMGRPSAMALSACQMTSGCGGHPGRNASTLTTSWHG